MRRVIVQEFVSLDGLAAGANGSVDFIPAAATGDHSFGDRQLAFMDTVDAILLGRITYEMFRGYWPNVTAGDDKPFAECINALPKLVFSKTLAQAPWGSYAPASVIHDAATEVAKLKRTPGKDMVIWGSISLAQSLDEANLVDEFQLIMCPAVLGQGRPLFEAAGARQLKLRQTQVFDRGTVLLAYVPA